MINLILKNNQRILWYKNNQKNYENLGNEQKRIMGFLSIK